MTPLSGYHGRRARRVCPCLRGSCAVCLPMAVCSYAHIPAPPSHGSLVLVYLLMCGHALPCTVPSNVRPPTMYLPVNMCGHQLMCDHALPCTFPVGRPTYVIYDHGNRWLYVLPLVTWSVVAMLLVTASFTYCPHSTHLSNVPPSKRTRCVCDYI